MPHSGDNTINPSKRAEPAPGTRFAVERRADGLWCVVETAEGRVVRRFGYGDRASAELLAELCERRIPATQTVKAPDRVRAADPDKPPKLAAPGTAETRKTERAKDAG